MALWGCEVGRSSLAVTWAFTCPGSRNRDVATIPSHLPEGMNTGALVLAQASASFSRSELRWEFANISAAVVFFVSCFSRNRAFLLPARDSRSDAHLLCPVLPSVWGQSACLPSVLSLSVQRVANLLELPRIGHLEHTLFPRRAIPLPSR